jgi:hypothetical protein
MKINSHLLGISIGVAFVVGWMWFADKEIETFQGYTIIKRKGKFVAERLTGERNTNPPFDTLDEVRAWVTTQQAQSAVSAIATSLPWNQ